MRDSCRGNDNSTVAGLASGRDTTFLTGFFDDLNDQRQPQQRVSGDRDQEDKKRETK